MRLTARSRRRRDLPRSTVLGLLVGLLTLVPACGGSPTGGDSPAPWGWGPPEILASEAVFDSRVGASLAGNGSGDAVAVWAPSNVVYPPVLARRFSSRDGWMPVETIDRGGDGSVATPTVRMSSRGDLVAMWEAYSGLRASTRAAGDTWGAPELVVPSFPSRGSWRWGLDDAGRALVAWPAGSSIAVARFEPALGWRLEGSIPGAQDVDFLEAPSLAVAASGHALAAWSTGSDEIWANAFDPQSGWSSSYRLGPGPFPGPVGTGPVDARRSLAAAFVNASGDGIVTWVQDDPSVASSGVLYASLYQRTTGFSSAEALGPTAGTVIAASLDADGNALAIYMSGLGLRRQRRVSGGGWQAPEPLDGVGGFDAVVLDNARNGWVLWTERSPGNPVVTLLSRRLADGRATGMAEPVAPPFNGFAWFRGTAMDAGGGLTAVWFQSLPQPDGAADRYSLVAGHYRAAGPP